MFLGAGFTNFVVKFLLLVCAHQSFRSLQSGNFQKDPEWLIFWALFGVYQFAEMFLDLIFGSWLPFYYEVKLVLVLGLGILGGSIPVYNKAVKGLFQTVDAQLNQVLAKPEVKPKVDLVIGQIAGLRQTITKKAN